ncbi:MAG: hypothetical protein K1X94_35555, partial [Sandaracinaceae bacterium]|nr:hypothetical protein [Sandaracinaceae bacterium]
LRRRARREHVSDRCACAGAREELRTVHTPGVRLALALACVVVWMIGCGGSTNEPARSEPQRVEAPPPDPEGEPAASAQGSPSAPRRVEASRGEGASASGSTSSASSSPARGHRPTVPPPPVEPPTF